MPSHVNFVIRSILTFFCGSVILLKQGGDTLTGLFTNLEKQQQFCKWSPLYSLKRIFYLYLGFGLLLLWIVGCNFPGGQNRDIPQIQLTIQNTLPVKRVNVPIVLSLAELRQIAADFSFDAYLVVSGQPPAELEIPSQADDTNYDGQKDELVFLVDLEPQETKGVTIRYAPDNQVSITLGFTRRTRAGIFPELKGFAALESEWVAHLLQPNGSIDTYGKKTKGLFLDQFVRQLTTPLDSDEEILIPLFTTEEMDSRSGFGLWDTDTQTLISPDNQRDYVRILADGPVRSIVQRIIPSWVLSSDQEVSFISTFSIYGGHQWGEHRVKVQGLGERYRIAVRLPNRRITSVSNEKDGWIWSWETEADHEMGFGVTYPVDGFDTFLDSEAGNTLLLMKLDRYDEVFYRFASTLGGEEVATATQETEGVETVQQKAQEEEGVEIATPEAFEQYVQATATEIRTPPVIRFAIQESQEPEESPE